LPESTFISELSRVKEGEMQCQLWKNLVGLKILRAGFTIDFRQIYVVGSAVG